MALMKLYWQYTWQRRLSSVHGASLLSFCTRWTCIWSLNDGEQDEGESGSVCVKCEQKLQYRRRRRRCVRVGGRPPACLPVAVTESNPSCESLRLSSAHYGPQVWDMMFSFGSLPKCESWRKINNFRRNVLIRYRRIFPIFHSSCCCRRRRGSCRCRRCY